MHTGAMVLAMSVDALNFIKKLPPNVPRRLLPLLYVLAEHTFNDSGTVKIGNEQLAAESRCSLATVKRYLRSLTDLGVIRVQHRGRADGKGGRETNVITLVGFVEFQRRQPEKRVPQVGPSQDSKPQDGILILRSTVDWNEWQKAVDQRDKRLGEQMRSQRAFAIRAPANRPWPGCPLPTLWDGSAERSSARSHEEPAENRAKPDL